ncbi:MAG: ABC transporter permease [Clostridia bacterium]|nr:ABC transporter permease [Clostridia bacterium]
MGKYVLKRLGYVLVVFLILSLLMYLVYAMIPYDRARAEVEQYKTIYKNEPEKFEAKYQELRKELGLDQNVFVRYLGWIGVVPINGQYQGLLQGDFGYSYTYDRPVVELLSEPMRNTVFINIIATIIALGITIPLGIFCATHRGGKRDTFIQTATIVGYSIPTFIMAIVFIWLLAILLREGIEAISGLDLNIFPVSGMKTPGSAYTGIQKFLDELHYMALPIIVMTVGSLGGMTRYVRASMTEALSMDCIRTARAKGLREKIVVYSHAWRNALIPIITLVIGWFLSIFSGSIMIENIFGLNGMGQLYIGSLNAKDFEVVLLIQMFYVIIGLLGNLVVDIAYGLADPRVRVNK